MVKNTNLKVGNTTVGNGFEPFPTSHGLSEIIRGFKTFFVAKDQRDKKQYPFPMAKNLFMIIL